MKAVLDSRSSLGSDVERLSAPVSSPGRWREDQPYLETSSVWEQWATARTVRVVLGHWGEGFRLSASELSIVVDGSSIEDVWAAFLASVRQRADVTSLTFDVGPLRPDEIAAALDAPEDEDWAEPVQDEGADV